MNPLEQHVKDLTEKIQWLSSITYKVHFNHVTSNFYNKYAYRYETLAEHIADEWEIDRMKFDDLRRELKYYKELLAIYNAERGLDGDRIV